MAYLTSQQQDDEELKKQQGTGGGLLGESAGTPGATAAPKPSANNTSGWTNLRAYLDANKDQAVDMSGKLASNITQSGQEAQNKINESVKGYQTELEKANPTNLSGVVSRATDDPVSFTKNTDDLQAFRNLRQGLYKGPGSFETTAGYADAQSAADKGAGLKTLAETEAGQQQLIRQINPNMGQGKVDLNQLLISGSPEARNTLVNAAKPFATLRDQLTKTAADQNAAREQAVQGTQALSKQIQDQFIPNQSAALQTLQQQINQRVQESSKDMNADKDIQDLMDFLSGKSANLSPEDAKQFFPQGTPSRYDESRLLADINRALSTRWPGYDASTRGTDIASGRPVKDMLLDYVYGKAPRDDWRTSGLNIPSMELLNPLRDTLPNYLTELFKGDPESKLSQYFSGTQKSSGNPDFASVANPDEIARLQALQTLLEQDPFLTEEDLARVGTYRPARINRYQPLIQDNQGTSFVPA